MSFIMMNLMKISIIQEMRMQFNKTEYLYKGQQKKNVKNKKRLNKIKAKIKDRNYSKKGGKYANWKL